MDIKLEEIPILHCKKYPLDERKFGCIFYGILQ